MGKEKIQTAVEPINGLSDDRDLVLKSPQSIVHIKHKISLQQYKYWILLLQELREKFDSKTQPDEKGFHSMPMAKLSEYLGYTPNKSEVLKDLLALKNETIAFNVLNKDGEEEKYGAGFISEWGVSNSFIRFRFPSFLEDVVRGLDQPRAIFSLINWQVFNHFTGKYEAIIYKLSKDYIGIGRTPDMEIAEFREYIGLKPTEYKEFEDLNKWCIKKPVISINESEISDIAVSTVFHKQGRKVIGLYFRVEHKKQQKLPFPIPEEISAFRFAKVAISPTLQAKYRELRAAADIELCIERANEYGVKKEKEGGAVNYGALYRRAITEGWHSEYAEKKSQEVEKKAKKEVEKLAQAQERATGEATRARESQEKADAWARFEALPETEKEEIREEYRSQADETARKLYAKSGDKAVFFKIFLKKKWFPK